MMEKLIGLMGRRWRLVALCCALGLVSPVRGESLTAQLMADAADGQLDRFDFFAAALVASGVDDACELAQWKAAYADLRLAVLDSPGQVSTTNQAGALQAALHDRILVGKYQASASDLRTTIARGDYNCLTALAVYWDLCCRAGISLEICSSPGHVSLLAVDGTPIEPGAAAHLAARLSSRQNVRRLTPVELLGKFYYNRGVERLQAGEFAAGIALLQTSLQLDPIDCDARENLLAGLNNWAVEHCRRRRYDLAAPLIARGLAIEPGFAPLVANERLVGEKLRQ